MSRLGVLGALVSWCLFPALPAAAQEPAVLARGGKSDWTISLPAGAGSVERFAAEEFRKYVEMMSGARLPDAGPQAQEHVVHLGLRSDLGKVEGVPNRKPGHDGYAVLAGPTEIWIAGENPRGVLYGVYDILERLGCRWFVPAIDPKDPEVIPKSPDLALPAGAWAEAGAIEERIYWAPGLAFEIRPELALPEVDWAAKCRYSVMSWQCVADKIDGQLAQMKDSGILDAMAKRGILLHGPGHSWPYFIPTEKYFKDHPDWFGMRDGTRRPHGGEWPAANFCLSNPGAAEAFLANVEAFLKAHPELQRPDLLSIDGGKPCQCDTCRTRPAEDWMVDLFNRLSDRLEKNLPGIVVDSTVGYSPMLAPPAAAVPNGKWLGLYAHWGRAHNQSYDDPGYGRRPELMVWTSYFRRFWICSYYAANSHQPFNAPPYLHAIAGDTAFMVRQGVTGALVLEYPAGFWWNNAFNVRAGAIHPYYYPDRDPRWLVRDYARHYFGPKAGPLLEEYFLMLGDNANLEASYWTSRGEAREGDERFLAEMRRILDRAAKLAEGDPACAYRVDKLIRTMEMMRRIGGCRSRTTAAGQAVERAAGAKAPKKAAAKEAARAAAGKAIAEARSYFDDVVAHAKAEGEKKDGVVDGGWVESWTVTRVYRAKLDELEKKLAGEAPADPAKTVPAPPPGPVPQ